MEILFLGWLVLSIVTGAVASSRGRSGVGFTLIAFLLSPLLAFIILLLLPNLAEQARVETLRAEDRRRDDDRQLEAIRATAKVSVADELTKLADLRDRGVLTEPEFQAERSRLLTIARNSR